MANNDLNLDPNPAAPAAPAAELGSEQTPNPGGMTPDQLQGAFSTAVAPLVQAVEQQGRELEAVKAGLKPIEHLGAPEPEAAPEASELAAQLLQDPIATIQKIQGMQDGGKPFDERVKQVVADSLGPGMARDLKARGEETLTRIGSGIDDIMGKGYFDEHIRPKMEGDEGTLAPFSLFERVDPKVVGAAANGHLGALMAEDPKAVVAKYNETLKAAEDAAKGPVNMMGPGIMPTVNVDHPSPEVLEGIKSIQAKLGEDAFTVEDWRTAVRLKGDGEAWMKHIDEQRAAAAKGA